MAQPSPGDPKEPDGWVNSGLLQPGQFQVAIDRLRLSPPPGPETGPGHLPHRFRLAELSPDRQRGRTENVDHHHRTPGRARLHGPPVLVHVWRAGGDGPVNTCATPGLARDAVSGWPACSARITRPVQPRRKAVTTRPKWRRWVGQTSVCVDTRPGTAPYGAVPTRQRNAPGTTPSVPRASRGAPRPTTLQALGPGTSRRPSPSPEPCPDSPANTSAGALP